MPETKQDESPVQLRPEPAAGTKLQQRGGMFVDSENYSGNRNLVPAQAEGDTSISRGKSRKTRLSFRAISFIVIVVIPVFLSGLYFALIQSSGYVSEFRVSVRSAEPMQMAGFASLFGLSSMSQSSQSANAIVQYLRSRKAAEDLDRDVGIRAMFSDSSLDYLSRLSKDSEVEKFVRYWGRMIDAYFETSTGTITVRVTAYTPNDAYVVAMDSLKLSEKLVNDMSERMRRDTVRIAEDGVRKAQEGLLAANSKVRELRDRFNIIDPKVSAETIAKLVSGLRQDLIAKRINLEVLQKSLKPDAPSIVELQAKIKALEGQLAQLGGESTQTGSTHGQTLSSAMSNFQEVVSEVDFATKYYESALASLKQAEQEASRQQLYLAIVVPPGEPQEAAFPRPLMDSLKVLLVALAVWMIAVVGVAAIREHR